MAAKKVNGSVFIRHLDKLQHRFGKTAIITDSATYHNSGRVRRYLEENDNFINLIFLPP